MRAIIFFKPVILLRSRLCAVILFSDALFVSRAINNNPSQAVVLYMVAVIFLKSPQADYRYVRVVCKNTCIMTCDSESRQSLHVMRDWLPTNCIVVADTNTQQPFVLVGSNYIVAFVAAMLLCCFSTLW